MTLTSNGSAEHASSRVLLIGHASRLLPALAADFHAQGAQVVLADADVPADLPTPSGLTAIAAALPLVRAAIERLGGLDVLVVHAQPGPAVAMLEVDPAAWRASVDALVGDAFAYSQAAAQAMIGSGGVIVHLIGPDALHAYPLRSVAAAGFAAISGLIRAQAVELARHQIRVVGVVHGPLETGPAGAPVVVAGDRPVRTIARSPDGRLATAADISAGVRFVAGRRASFMTGQVLRVDGGWASLNQAPTGMKFP
jgi:NAD(P)-dependent dehydrogenase (short-subunit alcohol dehydrogenase family)